MDFVLRIFSLAGVCRVVNPSNVDLFGGLPPSLCLREPVLHDSPGVVGAVESLRLRVLAEPAILIIQGSQLLHFHYTHSSTLSVSFY